MSSTPSKRYVTGADLSSRGEPYLWSMGGALALGLIMIFGFLALVAWNGFVTFYPKPVEVLRLKDGAMVAGEPTRSEMYRLPKNELDSLDEQARKSVQENKGFGLRTLYRTGNFDLYNEDFVWVSKFKIAERSSTQNPFLYRTRGVGTLHRISSDAHGEGRKSRLRGLSHWIGWKRNTERLWSAATG